MAVPATVHADVVTGPIKIKVIDYIFFPWDRILHGSLGI